MNKPAPVLKWEEHGMYARAKYAYIMEMYGRFNGYTWLVDWHHVEGGEAIVTFTRTENGEKVVYVVNDDYSFDRFAPELHQRFDGLFGDEREPARYGVFINDKEADFTGKIISGIKKYETRTRRMLDRLILKRVAIIRTGKGVPQIVGYCWIVDCKVCETKEQFDRYREECCCDGTDYDWKEDTKRKYLYKIKGVRECTPHPLPYYAIRHGRSWIEM